VNDTPQDAAFHRIRAALAGARGPDRAIEIGRLQVIADLPSRRQVEQLLQIRLADFPWPLVAGPQGYFIPDAPEQINHYLASLRSRAMCIFARYRTVRLAAQRAGWRREGRRFTAAPAAPPPPTHQPDLFAP